MRFVPKVLISALVLLLTSSALRATDPAPRATEPVTVTLLRWPYT
jgi:hypothetical protein